MAGWNRTLHTKEAEVHIRHSGRRLIALSIASALLLPTAPLLAPASPASASVHLPPAGGVPDYQLGGAYEPDPAVTIVARDRREKPAQGRYSICYINGFQTQPGERRIWPKSTLLRHRGKLLHDPGWPDEILLDTSTAAKRKRIARILNRWIERCATDGFQAVEFDNLDSYTRSKKHLKLRHNIALAKRLVRTAHRHGLAAGQKNTAEASRRAKREARFDFAVTESCARWNECRSYTKVYGARVIDIEYADETSAARFAGYCARAGAPRSMVLRDHDLVARGGSGYVFRLC
ncbi:MAG: endo alpha-1,4 polygalactosaminidase [Actinobacteria bacterium]|nr:endo alpha-1,4 polygalactosaminidase [Actinomycetota bacterium]